MTTEVFNYTNRRSATVKEYCDGKAFYLEYAKRGESRKLFCYPIIAPVRNSSEPYLGYTLEEVTSSGRDILGEKLLEGGEPDYNAIPGVLPPITVDAYCFLGGPASHAGVTVDRSGVIFPQLSGRDDPPAILYSPSSDDPSLEGLLADQYMLDGRYPLLFNVFTVGDARTELLYFVDSGDPDRDPIVWIREKKYNLDSPKSFSIRYGVREFSHGHASTKGHLHEVTPALFLDTLIDTVAYWLAFNAEGAEINIPNADLSRVTEGALSFARQTFTGPRPHYGHRYYGKELHDNFPPNYIWTIEAAILMGHTEWAREIFDHMTRYALSADGSFAYRQGLIAGASATEYAMLLWLTRRFKSILAPNGLATEIKEKLIGMGDELIAHFIPCPELDGRRMIKMCAEADNNVRVNVYLNNNLWAIRGFEALAYLIPEQSEYYISLKEELQTNVTELLKIHSVKDPVLGTVPPFRFGYPAIPYTLSNCKTDRLPTDEASLDAYFNYKMGRRDYDVTGQEITENTYANYRYYPEIFSSMLLSDEYTDALYKMRAELGGNVAGMTRFRTWVDDWAVLSYARFLIEKDHVDDYLLLLYSHTLLHASPELICYYEQIKLDGRVSAHDCVPSLLTTPIMTVWTLAYENVDGDTLSLLRATPRGWFEKGFDARGIGTSRGMLDISYADGTLKLRFDSPTTQKCEVYLRDRDSLSESDIRSGKEYIADIKGNKIILKNGISDATISLY